MSSTLRKRYKCASETEGFGFIGTGDNTEESLIENDVGKIDQYDGKGEDKLIEETLATSSLIRVEEVKKKVCALGEPEILVLHNNSNEKVNMFDKENIKVESNAIKKGSMKVEKQLYVDENEHKLKQTGENKSTSSTSVIPGEALSNHINNEGVNANEEDNDQEQNEMNLNIDILRKESIENDEILLQVDEDEENSSKLETIHFHKRCTQKKSKRFSLKFENRNKRVRKLSWRGSFGRNKVKSLASFDCLADESLSCDNLIKFVN